MAFTVFLHSPVSSETHLFVNPSSSRSLAYEWRGTVILWLAALLESAEKGPK